MNTRTTSFTTVPLARLTSLLLTVVATTAGAAQQFGIGIHVGQNSSQVITTLTSGPFSYRTDAKWAWVEATQGNLAYPSNLQAWLDPITSAVVHAGAQPLVVLDYGDKFYDGGGDPTSSAGIAAYAKYAGFMASHYKGSIAQFEIWNEWNLSESDTNAVAGTANAYVNLLKAAYVAIKAANPSATVVAGSGVANLDDAWIAQFIRAGGLNYADAFSVHPYVHARARKPANPAVSFDFPLIRSAQAQTLASPLGGTPEDAMAWLDKLHTTLANASSKSIPIYVTEIGWATNTGRYGFLESTSAAYLQRFLLLAHTRSYIGGVWWYDLMDDGADGSNYFQRFGLLRQSGAQKPAYTALMQIKDLLLAPAIATQGSGPNGEITVSGQLANGKQYFAAWLPTDDFTKVTASANATSLGNSGYEVLASATATIGALSASPLVLEQH